MGERPKSTRHSFLADFYFCNGSNESAEHLENSAEKKAVKDEKNVYSPLAKNSARRIRVLPAISYNLREVITSFSKYIVRIDDLLRPNEWLNNEVLNSYIELL